MNFLVVDIALHLLQAKFHSFKSVLELQIMSDQFEVVVRDALPEDGIVRGSRGMNHWNVIYNWYPYFRRFHLLPIEIIFANTKNGIDR